MVGIRSCSPDLISFDCSSVVKKSLFDWWIDDWDKLSLNFDLIVLDGRDVCFCSSLWSLYEDDCGRFDSTFVKVLGESSGVGDRVRFNGDLLLDGRRDIVVTSRLSRSVSVPVSSGNWPRLSSPDLDGWKKIYIRNSMRNFYILIVY